MSRATAPVAVRVTGLTKRFAVRRGWRDLLRRAASPAPVVALRDVGFEVREGEFFGLLGPNGAGKTTLFRMLATLAEPDEGTALVCGHDVRREAAAVRRLLVPAVADDRSLFWRLPADENLRLFAALYRLPRAEVRGRIAEVLERVGLADTGPRLVGTFSSGMRQRLLVARALLPRPRVLLLDEPTRSLDPISARAFRAFLREEVAGRAGCAVLLATHSAEEALELCDRVAVLDRGRLLATGPAAELARALGEDRHRLWTTMPAHPALPALVDAGLASDVAVRDVDADGWTVVEMLVPGGPARAADVVAALARAGVTIARFEPVPLSLAELIERTIARSGGR